MAQWAGTWPYYCYAEDSVPSQGTSSMGVAKKKNPITENIWKILKCLQTIIHFLISHALRKKPQGKLKIILNRREMSSPKVVGCSSGST